MPSLYNSVWSIAVLITTIPGSALAAMMTYQRWVVFCTTGAYLIQSEVWLGGLWYGRLLISHCLLAEREGGCSLGFSNFICEGFTLI